MLAAVERELDGEPFVAIGVHSPKFPNERDPEMVREAVRRYGVTHPVVVDSGMRVWSQFGVRLWPTLVVLDPEGYIVGPGSGEPDQASLAVVLGRVLGEARERGALTHDPLPLRREPVPPGSLSYPGKVTVAGDLVIVADTGHEQLVLCDASGAERTRIGDGQPGLADGDRLQARFHRPNGLALVDGALYVADTGNHAIRRVDLESGSVSTVAGTGRMGRGEAGAGGPAREAWTVCGSGDLFGFGDRDGGGEEVRLQHPMGIAAGHGVLYVADTFNHKVKAVDPSTGACRTLFGSGQPERLAELVPGRELDPASHDAPAFFEPEGVAAREGELIVPDTNNHRVVAIELAGGARRALLGG